jgi:hypothetical protein
MSSHTHQAKRHCTWEIKKQRVFLIPVQKINEASEFKKQKQRCQQTQEDEHFFIPFVHCAFFF